MLQAGDAVSQVCCSMNAIGIFFFKLTRKVATIQTLAPESWGGEWSKFQYDIQDHHRTKCPNQSVVAHCGTMVLCQVQLPLALGRPANHLEASR
jgi:hypothetical protein